MDKLSAEKRLSKRSSVDSITNSTPRIAKYPIINDISTGGMQFTAPIGFNNISTGDLVNFLINFPNSSGNNVWGEILHIRHFPDETAHYGVKFLKLNWPVWNFLSHYKDDSIEIAEIQKLTYEDLEKISTMQQQITPNSYHIKLVTNKPLNGDLEDINFGGAKLHLEEPIEIDSAVTGTFFFEKNMLVVEGICVWCSRINQETKSFLIGLNFKNLDQKQFYLLSELVLKLNHLVK